MEYAIALSNGAFTWRTTVRKAVGTEVVLFADDCSSVTSWTTNGWGTTASRFTSAPACITDSPLGDYPSFATTEIPTAQPIALSLTVAPRLLLNASWEIESRNHMVQVLSSGDGLIWTPLCGRIARPGYANQGLGEPVFDAQSPDWRREEIDLSDHTGGPCWLRFRLSSNDSREYDGIYIDDVRIVATDLIGGAGQATAHLGLSIFPIPAPENLVVNVDAPRAQGARFFELHDVMGALVKRVSAQQGRNELLIGDLAPGTYACKLVDARDVIATQRVAVIR